MMSNELMRQENAIAVRREHADQSSDCGNVSMSLISRQNMEITEREIEAQNQADIARARFLANYHRQNDRPRNTKINYGLKQRAWKEWCDGRQFTDLNTVTDGKLLLWLQEVVIPQGNQSSGDKKGSMLSKSGLEGYVKPIIDLYEVHIHFIFLVRQLIYQQQVAERRNTNGLPRSAAVKGLLKHYEAEQRKANFNADRDRGKDTIRQFGTLPELTRTVDMQFTIETAVAMRTRMDLLVG